MSDDERIARITELARRIALAEEPDVRPELHTVEVERLGNTCTASALLGRVRIEGHPRALDALEAALLVLAEEPPPLHWVEPLASSWEARARNAANDTLSHFGAHDVAAVGAARTGEHVARACAEELRERARSQD